MHQYLHRFLLPLIMVVVTQTTAAQGIRLTGPDGQLQASPQFSEPVVRQATSAQFYGPTTEQETLWSIATRLRPSTAVTVQQTLYAIFLLNPQAFENQNIHELIPQSRLRIPSREQVRAASTQEAVKVMAAHQARLKKNFVANTDLASKNNSAQKTASTQRQVTPLLVKSASGNKASQMADKHNDLKAIAKQEQNNQVKSLENQLETSETELVALEEKNHKLRLMLAEVQSEVDVLKNELGDEDRIRLEVEKLLEEERQRLAEEQKMAPSTLDKLFANTWLVAALAIIPGLLIGLLIMALIGRRSKQEPEVEANDPPPSESVVTPAADPVVAETADDNIDDDLLLDDDLFGESGSDDLGLDGSLDSEQNLDENQNTEDNQGEQTNDNAEDDLDIFADLDDSELDLNLDDGESDDPFSGIDDEGDLSESLAEELDLDISANGISVNGDDKALGIEEMERALDEVAIDDANDEGFDLADESDLSQQEFDELLAQDGNTEALDTDELDQSLLDDLFEQTEEDNDELDFDTLLDEGADNQELDEPSFASDSDIDDIFAQMEQQADLETLEATALDGNDLDADTAKDTQEIETQEADVQPIDVEQTQQDESSISTENLATDNLFDELITLDEPSEESVELLDEFITEDSEPLDLDSELDELIEADSASNEIDLSDSTDLLADVIDAESPSTLDEELGDDATDFFEEMLEIDDQHSADEQITDDIDAAMKAESAEAEVEAELETDSSSELDTQDLSEDDKNFASEEFVDDLLSVAPEGDPLLDELDLADDDIDSIAESPLEAQTEQSNDSVDLSPSELDLTRSDTQHIEAVESESDRPEPDMPQAIANEFGVPQDDDWDVQPAQTDEPEQEASLASLEPSPLEIDDADLPEFGEAEAEALAQSEDNSLQDTAQIDAQSVQAESELPLEFDDADLPEFGEQEAEALAQSEANVSSEVDEQIEANAHGETELAFEQSELGTDPFDEQNQASSESEILDEMPISPSTAPVVDATQAELVDQDYNQQTFDELLSEEPNESANFAFDAAPDSVTTDSAGLDMDTMLDMGEDWNGFNLSPEQQATISDEIPADQADIWAQDNTPEQTQIDDENWQEQQDLEAFVPKENSFRTIDELMAEVESEPEQMIDDELKLDVGLNDFPDVIGDINADTDVDANAEAVGKLDLAKIYIEMNDTRGAIKLLEEAIVDGSDDVRREAKNLIDTINKS